MKPKDREKRWIKFKGCKNASRMWREDLKMWTYVPMNPDLDFTIELPKRKIEKVKLKIGNPR